MYQQLDKSKPVLGRKELRKHKEEIIKMYIEEKKSTYQIGEIFNAYSARIKDILKENNIKLRSYNETNRKYHLNEHFFDNIDTEEKAYILGFLYADGCNSKSKRNIKLEISIEDLEILEKIKIASNNETPINYSEKKTKKGQLKQYCSLSFNSQYMAKILSEKGVVERKSLVLQFPEWLDKKLYSHFIRGYFDGDGSVSKSGKGLQCSIISTIYFNKKIQLILNELNIETILVDSCNNGITTTLRICRQNFVKIFLDYIYKDATIYLKRKYNKYINQYYNN